MSATDVPDWTWPVTTISPSVAVSVTFAGAVTSGVTGQVAVGTGATEIVAANPDRSTLTIYNPTGGQAVFVGPAGVTTSTGYRLDPGYVLAVSATQAWYGIVASGSVTVSYEDE